MFLFILSILLVPVAGGLFIAGQKGVMNTWWSGIPLFFSALFLLFASAYTQDPGEAIVIKSFTGKVIKVDTTSGLGFTAPWNSVIKFDIRNQRIEMFTNDGGQGKDGAVITAPLQGSSNAYVSITVRYSIKPGSVRQVYELHKNQGNLKDNVLKPGVRDEVRVATSAYPPFQVKERRAELTEDIRSRLAERWEPFGVTIDDIDLGDLALDEKTEEALRVVNERQAQVESARADLERAYIEAETVKTEAQAQADADQIIRCGATTTTETREIAGKPEQVTVITPKQGAECENRLNEQVLTSKYLDTLEALGDSGNMVVIIPNSPNGGAGGPIINLPRPSGE